MATSTKTPAKTTAKKAEELTRLSSAIENTTTAIMMVDRDLEIF